MTKIVKLVLNTFTHDARVHKEAKTLAGAGHNVTVLAYQDGSAPDSEQSDGFRVQRIALRSDNWRVRGIRQLSRYLEFTFRAARLASALEPDVCHAHAIQALPACWLASQLKRCHLIYDAHEFERGRDFVNAENVPTLMRIAWSLPETLFIHKANVITVSDSLADALAETYHMPKPLVVRNCPESFSQVKDSTWLRVNYNIPKTSPIILYQGGLVQGRGLENLVQCAEFLPKITVAIVGSGPLDKKLRTLVHELPNQKQVIFVGRVPLEQLPKVTASADIGVILTQNTCMNHHYSLPNKLFEYIQAGIPVVGSNLPEIANVITTYQVGEVVNPDDPAAVAAALQNLLDDPHYYARTRANTARAAHIFNWERESEKLISLYAGLEK